MSRASTGPSGRCVPSAGITSALSTSRSRIAISAAVIAPAREWSRVWSGGTTRTRRAPASITRSASERTSETRSPGYSSASGPPTAKSGADVPGMGLSLTGPPPITHLGGTASDLRTHALGDRARRRPRPADPRRARIRRRRDAPGRRRRPRPPAPRDGDGVPDERPRAALLGVPAGSVSALVSLGARGDRRRRRRHPRPHLLAVVAQAAPEQRPRGGQPAIEDGFALLVVVEADAVVDPRQAAAVRERAGIAVVAEKQHVRVGRRGRSPLAEAVVAAVGARQRAAEHVDRARFAVVVGEDRGVRPLGRRDRAPRRRHRRDEPRPADLLAEIRVDRERHAPL